MGNSWRNHELETRLTGLLIISVLLVIMLTGLWLLYRTRARMDALLQDKLEAAGKTAYREYLRQGVKGSDSLWSSWKDLASLYGLSAIISIDSQGRAVAEYNEFQPWNIGLRQPGGAHRLPKPGPFGNKDLQLSPVYHGPGGDYRAAYCKTGQAGMIMALEFRAGEETGISQAVNILTAAVIFGFGLVLLIGLLLFRKIFLPFRQMAAGARNIMGEAAASRPGSDVDLVTTTYLMMVEQLKARGETLKALYEDARSMAENSELAKQQVADSLDAILITVGREGQVTSFNRAAAMAAGGSAREAVTSWLNDNQLPGSLQGEGTREWESEDPRLGRRFLRARSFELKDSLGTCSGRIIAVEDVTAIRDLEDQARLNEQARLMAEASQGLLNKITPEIAALREKAVMTSAGDSSWIQHLAAVEIAVADLGRVISYQPPGSPPSSDREMVVASPSMEKVMELVRRVAQTDSTVIITGESGTGKELAARAIHAQSSRRQGPFVSVNCGALPETLLESELFGYMKGAFTGAVKDKPGLLKAAGGGTFFLDEISELPLALQVKLLRVLQEREATPVGGTRPFKVEARIIAATNQDLEKLVDEGSFRKDLYFRLNVFPVELPPLRQRPEEIRPLTEHFLKKHCQRAGTALKHLSRPGLEVLLGYGWPGNIRELENVIERAVVLSTGTLIRPEHLSIRASLRPETTDMSGAGLLEISARAAAAAEEEVIRSTLKLTGGNKSQAARRLKISYRVMLKKIKDYSLS
jgi:transcriptional regulator with PAS, ATPase and Fis domain